MAQKNIKKNLSKAAIFFSVLALLSVSILTVNAQKKLDFFGNKLSDFALLSFPPNSNDIRWRILKNENPSPTAPGAAKIIDVPWGRTDLDFPPPFFGILPAFGDYTGNGINDLAVYRSSGSPANNYLILPVNPNQQPPGNPRYVQWGDFETDFQSAEGDYDGDGIMDPTAVRATGDNYLWYVMRSRDNTFMVFSFGLSDSDVFLPGADYNGDGIDDPAVYRVGDNGQITWYIGNTSGVQISQVNWGNFNTDFIVPAGDYDGDKKADFMVWRGFGSDTNGVWYLRTNSGNISYTKFGVPADAADARDTALRSGDYDGDGKTDIAVYRQSNSTFYVLKSNGGVTTQKWGVDGNTNLPLAQFGTY